MPPCSEGVIADMEKASAAFPTAVASYAPEAKYEWLKNSKLFAITSDIVALCVLMSCISASSVVR